MKEVTKRKDSPPSQEERAESRLGVAKFSLFLHHSGGTVPACSLVRMGISELPPLDGPRSNANDFMAWLVERPEEDLTL